MIHQEYGRALLGGLRPIVQQTLRIVVQNAIPLFFAHPHPYSLNAFTVCGYVVVVRLALWQRVTHSLSSLGTFGLYVNQRE